MALNSRAVRLALVTVVVATTVVFARVPQAPRPVTDISFPQFSESEAREYLTYLSSDELQGREVFTEGFGLAAGYIAGHLREWGVKPLGDDGTFFQSVKQRSYQITRNSTVAIQAAGQSRTFKHGDHVSFSVASGGAQRLTFKEVEIGSDFRGRDVTGKLVVLLPGGTTPEAPAREPFVGSHGDYLVRFAHAAAVITVVSSAREGASAPAPPALPPGPASRASARAGRGSADTIDLTTVERVDRVVAPVLNADTTVLDTLLSGASLAGDLRSKIEKRDAVAPLTLSGVDVTIAVDNTFTIVSTDLTQNVVGLIEGTDPALRDTYVFYGAHLDHVGYSHRGEAKGAIVNPIDKDRIWNGADDDGSGSTALLLIAKAFATGPRPKRSVVFVWHAGEEAGLLGSRYMADFPVVPLDRIQVELNIDMIGRNRDNKDSESDTLYVIGADRISTDLHNLIVRTNAGMARPLTLDYEFNDLKDPNDFYTRSDHYSYASRGIPIAFFFTGTHPDYHANSDSVDKILFPKLLRIAQMVYQTGYALAANGQALERDNQGPRSGKGFSGLLDETTH